MQDNLLTVKEQYAEIDSWRQSHLTDVKLVSSQLKTSMAIKLEAYKQWVTTLRESNKILSNEYPKIFNYVCIIDTDKYAEIFGMEDGKGTFRDTNVVKKTLESMVESQSKFDKENTYKLIEKLLNQRKGLELELIDFLAKEYEYLGKTFPQLLKLAVKYNITRTREFTDIYQNILANIEQVQQGKISQEKCTENVLENDLGIRFFSGNDCV